MPLYIWMVIVGCIGATVWAGAAWWRKERQKIRTELKLDAALTKIHQLEEELLRKTALREGKEEKLRGYLQLMDTLINTIPNPIYFKDADGLFQGCNKVFAKDVLGLTRDRIIGMRPQELSDRIPPDLAAAYQHQEMIMAEKGGFHSFEAQVQCAEGARRDFLFTLATIWDEQNHSMGSVTVLSDLTEKNRAAEDRLKKEKLEGVLETAGGVCHELNQPLQALSGYLELMAIKSADQEELFPYIEKAMAQIDRIAAFTAKLQRITHYETMSYTRNTNIIDIHKSSR